MKLDSLLDEIADRVADRILQKLGTATAGSVYTTAKAGPHIPGKSRAWMLRKVKTMPGARCVGRDWIISVEDFQRWATAMDAMRTRAVKRPPTDVEALADAFLEEAGYRPTKTRAA